jgi:G3E family GTPase
MRVNLLFGFLGSGKTTLAKHLLAQRGRDMKTAVIVNEFGEVGVDGDILRGSNIDVVELNSGCLCCTLRGSLMLAVEELREKAKVERVIVEATGVAQPGELVETLANTVRDGGEYDIGPLVTVVDAAKFPKLLSMLGDFYVDQVESADIVLVNKIDLVDADQLASITRQVREINPEADILFAEQGKVVPEQLFKRRDHGLLERALESVSSHDHSPGTHVTHTHGDHDEHDHGHDHEAHEGTPQSFVVHASGAARRSGVERFFTGLPDSVWRAKGFLHVDGEPALVQYSMGQLEITSAERVPEEAIVFIGQGMDRSRIEADFALMSNK